MMSFFFFSISEYHYNVESATEEKLRGIKRGAAVINTSVGNLVEAKEMS